MITVFIVVMIVSICITAGVSSWSYFRVQDILELNSNILALNESLLKSNAELLARGKA